MANLENKTILIIGGTSGIGFGVAKASLKSLAKVIFVASSNKARVDNAVKRLIADSGPKEDGSEIGEVHGRVVDASKEESVKQLLDDVGEVDHIVFTSNVFDRTQCEVSDVDINAAKDLMDLRLWSMVAVAKYAKFRPGGSLTLTNGTCSYKPSNNGYLYTTAEAAVHGLAKGLAVALRPIRVNVVCPGIVETELWDQLGPYIRTYLLQHMVPKLLVQRSGTPDEVAEAYLFCMKCSFLTGQIIIVDGGQLRT